MKGGVRLFTIAVVWCVFFVVPVSGFDLTLLHTNDVHARIEQFNRYGTNCSDDNAASGKCFGGVARRKTKVREIRASHENVLLLDAGDHFLGTLWFNYYKGQAASHFMREIGYDAMCLGNHEFDLGVDGLVAFLDNVTFPVVSVNTDVTEEPLLHNKFASSHEFTMSGEKVGVIGFITQETAYISNAGQTVHFADVLTSIEAEVTRLTNSGVNKIIALGHAGYAMDQQVAQIEGVDVVVGGHTNTFLYTGLDPSSEVAEGAYPTVVHRSTGSQCLVVQAFTWGKYLGYLNLTFDAQGHVTNYSGNPVLLDNTVTQDPDLLSQVQEWSVPLKNFSNTQVGTSKVFLDGSRASCRLKECMMGNFFMDAIIDYHLGYPHSNDSWAPAAIAIWNGGGMRASIDKGTVTLGDVMTVLPFGNTVDLIHVRGYNLRNQLELSVRDWNPIDANGRFLQFSGLRVEYNLTKPVGERVLKVDVRCLKCEIPSYSPLNDNEIYSIFTSSFIVHGGDGYSFDLIKLERFSTLETDVMTDYFKKHSPVFTELDGRITFRNSRETSSTTTVSASMLVILMSALLARL